MRKIFVDLEPNPRLIDMLGRLPLKGWQCMAELVDNSLDAMIKKQDSDGDEKNEIRLTLPSAGEIDQNVPLIISDNGSGMNKKQLTTALTTGMSGKTTDSDLGLFGMGFNIATAKLSHKTTVWTSVKDSDKDIGITIDIPEMVRTNSFKRELLYRKNSDTSTKGKHGTTIEIKDYKPEAKSLLHRPDLIRNLKYVYSSIISEKYNIDIKAKGSRGWVAIEPKRFCLWDKDRSISHRQEGEIKPYKTFNQLIAEIPFCTKCLIELSIENLIDNSICPQCASDNTIINKKYHVKGWVGIQRYFSEYEYGFDIVRNGRIIKEWDKSLFWWNDRTGRHERMLEYPIDNSPLGGRIVGEIHADFILPEFTKDNFPITEQWLDVVEVVRGPKPIQEGWVKNLRLGGKNRSPLAMLFYGFRYTNPGRKNLVCGVVNGGASAGNKKAIEYKRKFYDGDPEFQSDEKWYELVMVAEEGTDTGGPGLPGPEDDPPTEETPETVVDPYPGLTVVKEEKIFELDRIDVSPITAKIFDFTPRLANENEFNPVIFEAESANVFHVRLNQNHTMLKDFEEGWQDLVLMEIAERFHSRIYDTSEWPISKIYFELKSKYYPERILNIDQIVITATNLMRELQNYLISESFDLSPKPNLRTSQLEKLKNEYREIENKNLNKPSRVLRNTSFVKYLDFNYLHEFIRDYPYLIFDGKFLNLSFREFDDDREYQSTILKDHFAQFSQIAWITDVLIDMTDIKRKQNKRKIISAKLALQYLINNRV